MCALYCAQLLHTILHRTDLITFSFTLQTITITPMMSIWGKAAPVADSVQPRHSVAEHQQDRWLLSSVLPLFRESHLFEPFPVSPPSLIVDLPWYTYSRIVCCMKSPTVQRRCTFSRHNLAVDFVFPYSTPSVFSVSSRMPVVDRNLLKYFYFYFWSRAYILLKSVSQ